MSETSYVSRLRAEFYDNIRPALMTELGIKNPMAAPGLHKIVVNMGCKGAVENKGRIEAAVRDLATITGQRPTVRKARKSIAGFKLREGMPIGAAVGLAGTYISGDPAVLGYSAFKFVNYPKLMPTPSVFGGATIAIDGRESKMEIASNLGAEIENEYKEMLPRILGAAISRMIVRAAAAEAARAGASSGGNEAAGWAAALLTEGLLVAADKPDTRSWSFLPGRVQVARVPVAPGDHSVRVELQGSGGGMREFDVSVGEGSYAAIIVTEPR